MVLLVFDLKFDTTGWERQIGLGECEWGERMRDGKGREGILAFLDLTVAAFLEID